MRRAWAAGLLLALLPAACGSDPEPSTTVRSYVAMGDSFVSGPGIAPVIEDSGACLRSGADYPALLARALGVESFTDVSCGGATTDHLVEPFTSQTGPVDAQLEAVTEDTDLVTVGIGGNDGNLYEGLFNSCFFPTIRTASGCRHLATVQAPRILAATEPKIVRALRAVVDRAPRAEVVLVGYLRIMPDRGDCRALRIDSRFVAHASSVTRAIEATQRSAAREAGVSYVSLRGISRGHDVCAGPNAWVNGLENTATDGIYLHPRSAGMRAAADHLAALQRSSPPAS